uniref:Double homeobox protein 1 n=1 Tax=Aceria tosichella TaxID=561515 RepID=A0A6G1S3H3_9ACAR
MDSNNNANNNTSINNNNNTSNSNNVLLLLAAITQHQQLSLLETLFSINQEPSAEAIELIAQRVNSTSQNVASWFHARREQHQVQQVAAAAAAAAASVGTANNHLSNLVLNNLILDQQQLQQHLQQQQSAASACLPNTNGSSSANISQYYYDYPISNASSSPTIQPQIQLAALNATQRNSADSPPSHLQNNSHLHHHHHHQDTSPASSSILAKLTAVTSSLAGAQSGGGNGGVGNVGVGNPSLNHHHNHQNHVLASGGNNNNKLDSRMIDLLEALYSINDNPEMGAIEMISKRVDVPCHLISDWFDKKRMKLNPFAGPRSPPVNKKREGGRVVTFSEYQRSLLEAIFNENNYLHPQEYEELSKLIQVPSRNIKIWFKNRRSKQRLSSGSRVVGNVRCDSDPIEQQNQQHLNHHQHHLQ